MRSVLVSLMMMLVGLVAASADPAVVIPYPGIDPEKLPPRLALVIGVHRYQQAGTLQLNPLPDTDDDVGRMVKLLDSLAFDTTVLKGEPDHIYVNKTDIQAAITDFKNRAIAANEKTKRAPILLFYFAGHGFNIDGKNFVLPSNFYADEVEDIDGNAINVLRDVVVKLGVAEPALQIIVIDACRSPAPPQLKRAGTNQMITATANGMIEPNKFRPAPQQEELGKNRTIFLYSTLDQQQAFGGSGGGRFTRALQEAFTTALNDVQNDFHAKPSLYDIFVRARYDIMLSPGDRWQRPQMDESWGAPFYPFPTENEFKLEKTTFSNLQKVPKPGADSDWNLMRDRHICNLRNMLIGISEFSYISWEIIQEIGSRPSYLPKLDCRQVLTLGGGTNGFATPPTRGPDGNLDLGGVLNPTKNPNGPPNPKTPSSSTTVPSSPLGPASQPSVAPTPAPTVPTSPPTRTLWEPMSAPSTRVDGSTTEREKLRLIRLAQANPSSGSASPMNDADPADAPSEPRRGREGKIAADAKPTFGDAQQASRNMTTPSSTQVQLDPSVPLDRAVVAKLNVFLRASPSSTSQAVAVIPAGELLEIIGSSADHTWIQVRHKKYGMGYVSGEYVESALVKLSKAISFETNAFELSEKAKTELAASFGALGGVLVVDAAIDYPMAEASIGFSRATLASQFIRELAVSSGTESNVPRLFIAVRPVSSDKIEPNTVRATILCLPLDGKTRAAIAQVSPSGQPSVLDLNAQVGENATSGSGAAQDLKICNLTGGNCKAPSYSSNGDTATVLDAVRDNAKFSRPLSAPVTDAVKRVQGVIRF
jgi:uncharacterized protein YgiM (DUF1202 family)